MRYPLQLELQPSRLTITLGAAVHAIAAFAFVRASLPPLLVAVALVLLGFSLRAALRAERRREGSRLVLEDDGGLVLEEAGGSIVYAVPEASCVDFGWAVWLHWRGARVRRPRRRILRGAMMLLPDNLSRDDWRGLRIWLRHKAAAGSADESGRRDAPV